MLERNKMPSVDVVRNLLDYDPNTGELRWRTRRIGRAKAGTIAGSLRKDGYITITINGVAYLAHRICWFHFHGKLDTDIDHEDTVRSNNKIANLRPASGSDNNANASLRHDNSTGFKGVSPQRSGRFQARIIKNKTFIHLGIYDTPQQAHEAYLNAAKRLFGEFARAA